MDLLEESISQSLLELHLSVTVASSALDLNLAKNYIWTVFPLSLEILLLGLGLKDKAPLFLVGLGHQFLSTHSWCSWRQWFLCSFLSFLLNILFNKLISSKLLCFCYMIFLDAWIIVLSIYKYFILFFIFLILLVHSLRFLRTKFKFVVKIIYLSIYLSHVRLDDRLDYDNINTILPLFTIFFSSFFPFEIVLLIFFKNWVWESLLI